MTGHHPPEVTDQDHVQGSDTASVTMIEYGDFECPHCGRAYPILKRVKKRLGDRLRFVFRHFPISELHPHAMHAAQAAESVAAGGGSTAFWAMHDLIFEHQAALEDADLARYATKAGVDGDKVLDDLGEDRFADVVQQSFMGGVRCGVNGTPTLFIDGVRYDGPRDFDTLSSVLEEVIERV